jgi:hypothetical protein
MQLTKIPTYFLLLLLLTCFCLSPVPARADLIMEGTKAVDYCFKVKDLSFHPDYLVIMYHKSLIGETTYPLVKESDCLSFYKHDTPQLFVLAKSDYQGFLDLVGKLDPSAIDSFFQGNPHLIPGPELDGPGLIKDTSPIAKIIDIYSLEIGQNNKPVVRRTSVLYTYTNSQQQEIAMSEQDTERPTPLPIKTTVAQSIRQNPFQWAGYLALSLIALLIILITVAIRNKAKATS